MTSLNGNIFRVTCPLWGPSQKPVTRSFDVSFDPRLNKQLSKSLWNRWFDTPSRSLWRHSNDGALFEKALWNLKENIKLFIQQISLECVDRKMAAILCRPQWVNSTKLSVYSSIIYSIIVSDNGRAVILTNAGLWSIGLLGINFGDIPFNIQQYSFQIWIWKAL